MNPVIPQSPRETWTPLQRRLVEQERTVAWLARKVGVSTTVMHRWATQTDARGNKVEQPQIPQSRRFQIAAALGCGPSDF